MYKTFFLFFYFMHVLNALFFFTSIMAKNALSVYPIYYENYDIFIFSSFKIFESNQFIIIEYIYIYIIFIIL